MKAFQLNEDMRAAADRRCQCVACVFPIFNGYDDEHRMLTRPCGEIHHEQRGHFHMALRPHGVHSNRRQRRERLQNRSAIGIDVQSTTPREN